MTTPRKPAAFVINGNQPPKDGKQTPSGKSGSGKSAKAAKPARKPAAVAPVKVVEDAPALPAATGEARARRTAAGVSRAFRWGRVLASAALGLFTLWAGAAVTGLIEDLFARSPVLGWIAIGLTALAALAALVIIGRELAGLMRLKRIERLHEKAETALAANDEKAMNALLARLRGLYAARKDMRWRIERLDSREDAIMTPAERLDLAERELLAPLDDEAARIIAATARQVAVMTAVLPAAALDIAFVAAQNLKMLRRLAALYGGRPGALGGLKLGRQVMTHLAFTGGLALTDNLVQHVLGKGLAGRLSARFGEGAVNGVLTARIGISALELVRPLPHRATPAPRLADFAKELFSRERKDGRDG